MRQLILTTILALTLSVNTVQVFAQIQNPGNDNIFTTYELETLNRLIEYYDSIVLSKTPGNSDIKTSYRQYFDSIFPIVVETGDYSLLAIHQENRTRFFSSLNQDFLQEIYQISNFVTYEYRGIHKTKYSPYILSLNFNGKYVDYLKCLSNSNKFLKQYYRKMVETHDFVLQ